MSTFKVEIVKVGGVIPHPNADRLDLLQIKDWQCVSTKGNFKQGDTALYIPIDSILPHEVESKIFGPDAKVKLHHSRVKTIKLRGAISQGLIVDPNIFGTPKVGTLKEGHDWTQILKIKKYEAPVRLSGGANGATASKKQSNPNFRKYTGIENAKNYPKVFTDGEEVSITEKVHGTNFRCGWVPFVADTLWKKFLRLIGKAPAFEFVYGSHNVQLQNKVFHKGYYGSSIGNVYAEAVVNYGLKDILKPGEVVYGEVYGDGIQKGYTYGCKTGERKLILFDLMKEDKWVDTIAFRHWADERKLPVVPELYRGPYSKDKVLSLRDGDSVLASKQKVREGVVLKPLKEEQTFMGRKVLKFISDEYLLKNQDDETEAH